MHGRTADTPLDRSSAATIARSGGRLAAVLLPLAALAVVRLLPGTPLPWVVPAIAAVAFLATGLALLVAITSGLTHGRLRDFADAAALGMLSVTFALAALGSTGALGNAVGMLGAAAAFSVASGAAGRVLASRRHRVVATVLAFVLAEALLTGILLLSSGTLAGPIAQPLVVAAALLLALAAVTGMDEPMRATAIGVAATSAVATALAASGGMEPLVGVTGIAAAAAVLGSWILVDRLPPVQTDPLAAPADRPAGRVPTARDPEYDEGARMARELRATIEELIGARRTIELQREEIERAATLDQLTGIPNRATILERLRVETAEARRYAHPIAVVLLDIDSFAQLNHDHGTEIGDAVLREVALRLRLRIREADALGRIAGDAFAAILPHTDEGGAALFAKAILDRLVARGIDTARGQAAVSASIGIALMRPAMGLSAEELLAAAEEALASAKAAGGNRIAFDRLHGLARLDERRKPDSGTAAAESAGDVDEADATR